MAISTCVKCGGQTFEVQTTKLVGFNREIAFVQCVSCGGVVGVLEFEKALDKSLTADDNKQDRKQRNFVSLDDSTKELHIGSDIIQLTSTEFRLLSILFDATNRAFTPGELLQAVFEYPPNTGDPDLIRAHIRNLRAKLDKTSAKTFLEVRTIHGVGYRLVIHYPETES